MPYKVNYVLHILVLYKGINYHFIAASNVVHMFEHEETSGLIDRHIAYEYHLLIALHNVYQ